MEAGGRDLRGRASEAGGTVAGSIRGLLRSSFRGHRGRGIQGQGLRRGLRLLGGGGGACWGRQKRVCASGAESHLRENLA